MKQKGFTLIELLVVIAIVAVLAAIVLLAINPIKIMENSRYSAAAGGLNQIMKAAQIYEATTGLLPADANRTIPTEFMSYLGGGNWPAGPFPGSVYDWDNWSDQTCWDGSTGIVQVTLRQINNYKGKSDYTLYLVLRGDGVPHCSTSTTKGECINCISRYP